LREAREGRFERQGLVDARVESGQIGDVRQGRFANQGTAGAGGKAGHMREAVHGG
jgi:hypothetical protein